MIARPIALLSLVIALLVTGCGQRPSVVYDYNLGEFDYDVVDAGDNLSLSMADLQKSLVESKLVPGGGVLDVPTIELFLDSLVTDTLAGIKAAGIRLEEHNKQYHLYRLRLHGLLTRRFFEEMVYQQVTIDSQEVLQIVHDNPELFMVEEHVLLYQIMVAASGLLKGPDSARYAALSKEQLEREAERLVFEVHEKALVVDSFQSVAREHSQDLYTRSRGGLVGWTPRGQYYDPFDSIAFSMKAGEVSQPYRDRDGWHILYIADHVPAGLAPVDKFYDFISQNALTIKTNALASNIMDSLRKEINLVYNDRILDKNIYYQAPDEWAAILNGLDTIDVDYLRSLEETYREKYQVNNTTPEMKKEALRELAERVIIVQAARKAGIDTLPDVARADSDLRHKYQKAVVLQDRYEPGWEPSDELIEYYYQQNLEQFTVDKPLTVQCMVVPDSVMGEFVRDQAMAGTDFLKLAQAYGVAGPEGQPRAGDPTPIGPADVSAELYRAAQITPVGETSHPVRTPLGYQVVKVLAVQSPISFDDARVKITGILKRDHVEEVKLRFRNALYTEYGVKFKGRLYPVHLKPLEDRIRQP
jgi:hypothetical protein